MALLGLAVLCTACRRDDAVQTYRVSKDSSVPMPEMPHPCVTPTQALNLPAAGTGSGTGHGRDGGSDGHDSCGQRQRNFWEIPPGWKEQPPSSMRVGSFLIQGTNGQTADVSVVPLSGMAGGDLANINRWRGQINLDPIEESELAQQSETISPGGRRMRLVDFASKEPLVANNYKKRVIAAIYTQGPRSGFLK